MKNDSDIRVNYHMSWADFAEENPHDVPHDWEKIVDFINAKFDDVMEQLGDNAYGADGWPTVQASEEMGKIYPRYINGEYEDAPAYVTDCTEGRVPRDVYEQLIAMGRDEQHADACICIDRHNGDWILSKRVYINGKPDGWDIIASVEAPKQPDYSDIDWYFFEDCCKVLWDIDHPEEKCEHLW